MERSRVHMKGPGMHMYRYEDDAYYMRMKTRSYSSSIDIGEFIFDLDRQGSVVGIEILNASKVFNVPKEALRKIISVHVEVTVLQNRVEIRLQLKASFRNGQVSGSLIVDKEAPTHMQPSRLQMAIA